MPHREGVPVAAVAAMVKARPEEVQRWIAEDGSLQNELEEVYYEEQARLRGERNCAKCGKELPRDHRESKATASVSVPLSAHNSSGQSNMDAAWKVATEDTAPP